MLGARPLSKTIFHQQGDRRLAVNVMFALERALKATYKDLWQDDHYRTNYEHFKCARVLRRYCRRTTNLFSCESIDSSIDDSEDTVVFDDSEWIRSVQLGKRKRFASPVERSCRKVLFTEWDDITLEDSIAAENLMNLRMDLPASKLIKTLHNK